MLLPGDKLSRDSTVYRTIFRDGVFLSSSYYFILYSDTFVSGTIFYLYFFAMSVANVVVILHAPVSAFSRSYTSSDLDCQLSRSIPEGPC